MSQQRRKGICISLTEREIQIAKIYGERIGATVSQVFRSALSEYVAAHKSMGFMSIPKDLELEVPRQ